MSGAAPLTPGLHRQQAAVVRERQAAPERLGGGQWAENKKEPLSQPAREEEDNIEGEWLENEMSSPLTKTY
ncbi:hypothetical protein KUCAC02_007509 [Chaenocephalus aceratus]|uniref:Uncharacterized protein n=1 Tax=Chaenocephalus aceratus TaxID=36190 RepID=A0ACB9X719_CHAAC|nr:hypothetical protein KUCAC02_007509 [Chaenocephalus aceratus]